MIEGSIAQSIKIWTDLNRFSIHESILLEIFFRNSLTYFGESSIHDSPENRDFESILDSFNRESYRS